MGFDCLREFGKECFGMTRKWIFLLSVFGFWVFCLAEGCFGSASSSPFYSGQL
jgi:hypothetical protein